MMDSSRLLPEKAAKSNSSETSHVRSDDGTIDPDGRPIRYPTSCFGHAVGHRVGIQIHPGSTNKIAKTRNAVGCK
jgi:hypothetical protein